LLQLSTYGSDERQSDKKVSQTLQLDEVAARELVEIISRVFTRGT
jgi:5-methylcytosine-specific restriction protein B